MSMTKASDVRLSRLLDGLKAAGVEHGFRNKTVAERAGYSENTVLKVLSGNAPLSPRFVRTVCDAFGVDHKWVMEGVAGQAAVQGESSPVVRPGQPGADVDMLVFREYGGVVSEILRLVKLMTRKEQLELLQDLGARRPRPGACK
jgi:hypothetical protein